MFDLDNINSELEGRRLVVESPSMKRALSQLEMASMCNEPVLIRGPRGSGKEGFARAVHFARGKTSETFIARSLAFGSEDVAYTELFGSAPGAYTGASPRPEPGAFELAEGGSLFLDEVHHAGAKVQSYLLRVIEMKEYLPLGARAVKRADVDIIVATNILDSTELQKAVLLDLIDRVAVLTIDVPPLIDRVDDLTGLLENMRNSVQRSLKGSPTVEYSSPGLATWIAERLSLIPGNLRGLHTLLVRAALIAILRAPAASGVRIEREHLQEASNYLREPDAFQPCESTSLQVPSRKEFPPAEGVLPPVWTKNWATKTVPRKEMENLEALYHEVVWQTPQKDVPGLLQTLEQIKVIPTSRGQLRMPDNDQAWKAVVCLVIARFERLRDPSNERWWEAGFEPSRSVDDKFLRRVTVPSYFDAYPYAKWTYPVVADPAQVLARSSVWDLAGIADILKGSPKAFCSLVEFEGVVEAAACKASSEKGCFASPAEVLSRAFFDIGHPEKALSYLDILHESDRPTNFDRAPLPIELLLVNTRLELGAQADLEWVQRFLGDQRIDHEDWAGLRGRLERMLWEIDPNSATVDAIRHLARASEEYAWVCAEARSGGHYAAVQAFVLALLGGTDADELKLYAQREIDKKPTEVDVWHWASELEYLIVTDPELAEDRLDQVCLDNQLSSLRERHSVSLGFLRAAAARVVHVLPKTESFENLVRWLETHYPNDNPRTRRAVADLKPKLQLLIADRKYAGSI